MANCKHDFSDGDVCSRCDQIKPLPAFHGWGRTRVIDADGDDIRREVAEDIKWQGGDL